MTQIHLYPAQHCTHCGRNWPLSQMTAKRPRFWCLACQRAYNQEYRLANLERRRTYAREWARRNAANGDGVARIFERYKAMRGIEG